MRLYSISLCLFIFFSLSILAAGCVDVSSIDDRVTESIELPDNFHGLEADIVYVADSVITRIDKDTNIRFYFHSDKISHKPQSIRITSDGRYAYFVDRPLAWNTEGEVVRLDLVTSEFYRLNPPITVRDTHLLNDTLFIASISSQTACGSRPSSNQVIMPVKNGRKIFLCTAIDEALENFGIQKQSFTNTGSVLNRDDEFYLYYREWHQDTEWRYTHYKFSLELTHNSIRVTAVDSLFSTNDFTAVSPTGRYLLFVNSGGLHLKDLETGYSDLIDADVKTLSNTGFHTNDEYVVVKKRREYSREFFLHDGYHVYHIASGTYRQVLPESLGMNAFRFSPDGSQILTLANFTDLGRWQVVVMNADGSNPAILSDRSKTNEMPRFRNVP